MSIFASTSCQMGGGGGGFQLRFDQLGEFLLTQGIYLDEPAQFELTRQMLGSNSLAARSQTISLSFAELDGLLALARRLQNSSCYGGRIGNKQ